MDKSAALALLNSGERITHRHFAPTEYMQKGRNSEIEFEDGIPCSFAEFFAIRNDESWEDGWTTYKEPEQPKGGKKLAVSGVVGSSLSCPATSNFDSLDEYRFKKSEKKRIREMVRRAKRLEK